MEFVKHWSNMIYYFTGRLSQDCQTIVSALRTFYDKFNKSELGSGRKIIVLPQYRKYNPQQNNYSQLSLTK